MGRILQCLVCITAMSSVLSQRGYYQDSSLITYSTSPHHVIQNRNLQYSYQPIIENLYRRVPDARKLNLETIPENPRLERETLEKYGSDINDRVVFPGPTSNEQSIKKEEGPKLTEDCKKRGFCGGNEVLNYPEEDVANLLVRLGDKVKFQNDAKDDSVQIAQRLGGGNNEQEVPLCTINETILHPKSLPDKDGKWWFVVNQEENPVQGFLAEICKTEDSNCSSIAKFQSGYKGTCKQKYVYRMVEAIDNGKHVQKSLRLPGCCSCVVTVVNNPFK